MKVKVELEIDIKGDATLNEVEEYLKYEFGYNGGCSVDNPFIDGDAEFKVTGFDCEEE